MKKNFGLSKREETISRYTAVIQQSVITIALSLLSTIIVGVIVTKGIKEYGFGTIVNFFTEKNIYTTTVAWVVTSLFVVTNLLQFVRLYLYFSSGIVTDYVSTNREEGL